MGRTIVLALTAATLLLFGGATAAQAQMPGNDGLLVFHSKRDGASEQIYTATRTGQTITRLTDNSANDTDPAWSPDGARIAFVSDRDGGDREIYVMNADGTGQTRITDHAGDDMDPAWSPDGSRIAIRRNVSGNNEIFLIDAADGGNPVNLTDHAASDFEPEFSPDGTKIVFQRHTGGGSGVGLGNEVFLMNADGSGQVNLTNNVNTINDGRPSFSPDGNRIAFDSNRNDGRFELYSMKLDGSDIVRVTNSAENKQNPAWAPSGTRIAWGNGSGLKITPVAAGPLVTVTSGSESNPHWQVDNDAPVTGITGGPANGSTVTVPSAEITFGANEPEVTFECRLDPAGPDGWSSCASPQNFTGLTDGEHTFEVRATDLGGNVEAAPASRSWTVDATAPVVAIESGPEGPVSSSEASIAFTVDDETATIECRFDSTDEEDWGTCESPWTASGLAEGDHNLEIRATDEAGNTSEVASRGWTVDTVAPTVTIDSAPDAVSHSVNAVFEFTADENDATFECRLDSTEDDDWNACGSPATWEELADGRHDFEVRATDPAGNVGVVQIHTWKIATVLPEATITSGPNGLVNADEATFEFESDLETATFECRLDSDEPDGWEACESPVSLTGLADGAHTFEVRATDVDQGTGPAASRSWTVDTVAPVVTIESGPEGLVTESAASVAFTVDDPAAEVECRFDSTDEEDWGTCESPWTASGLTDGEHSLEIRATDEAGNTSEVASRGWTVDTVAPVTTIDSAPPAISNSIRAEFEFSADDTAVTFECRLDSTDPDGWADCESPRSLGNLADGEHSFEVRATDEAGNTGPVVSHDWVVETTKPVATITSGPNGLVSSDEATFEFASDLETATFECRVDSDDPDGWEACESPVDLTGLADGDHTFEVRATDLDQGTGPAASRGWSVDTTAPVVTVDQSPASVTNSTDATVAFSIDDAEATVECRFDSTEDGDWTECESPWERAGLAEGEHTLELRATDQAGNTGRTEVTWTVDRTAPVATIDVAPPALNHSIRAQFEFSADEGDVTFECRLDSDDPDGWAECESPHSLNDLEDGEHVFEVKATDRAGNTGEPVSHTWQVETVKPVATITSGPADPTADQDATIEFDSDLPGATFECRVESGDPDGWEACGSPVSLTGLADGLHTFEVRATDLDQGTGPAASVTWTVDTVTPTVEITGAPAPISGTADPEFTFVASEDGTTAECRLDPADPDTPWLACTSPVVYSGLAEGSHRFEVKVTDAVGHTSEPASFEWIVETIPPEVAITSAPPESPTTFIDARFEFESTNQNAYFECRLDGGEWTECESPAEYDQLSDADHTFEVRAVGHGAGPGPIQAVNWTVDTVVPTVRITSGPQAITAATDAGFGFELNKSGSFTFECSLDGEPAEVCTSPAGYTDLAPGAHSFRVAVLDQDGDVVDSAGFEWTIVDAAPQAAITEAPPALSGSATAGFRFESDQPAAGFECELDGGDWLPCTSPAAFTGLADGSHTVRIRAVLGDGPDAAAGTPVEHTWEVDTLAPGVRIAGGPNGTVTVDSAVFTVTSDDPSASTECRLDGGAWEACDGEVELTGLADGQHQFRVRAVDAAGNTGSDRRQWTVDQATPVTTLTEVPEASTTARTARFDFNASKAGATFECRLDEGEWTGCSPVHSIERLELGTHTFEVRATDRNGITGDPATHSWDVVKPPLKGLVPTVKIRGKAKLDRAGNAPLATITCPEGVCRVTAPKRLAFRLKGRRLTPGLKVIRNAFRGKADVTLISSRGVRKLVSRFGPVRVKVKIKVASDNGKSRTVTRRVTLVAPR